MVDECDGHFVNSQSAWFAHGTKYKYTFICKYKTIFGWNARANSYFNRGKKGIKQPKGQVLKVKHEQWKYGGLPYSNLSFRNKMSFFDLMCPAIKDRDGRRFWWCRSSVDKSGVGAREAVPGRENEPPYVSIRDGRTIRFLLYYIIYIFITV